jgi:hypothetical protein
MPSVIFASTLISSEQPCGGRRPPHLAPRTWHEFQLSFGLAQIALGDRPNPAQDGVAALFAAACHRSFQSHRLWPFE